MKIKPQTSPDRVQLGNLIKGIPVVVMTKLDLYGNLVSRPLIPLEMDTNGAFWFFVDQRSVSTERLRTVNITFSDPVSAIYVSLSGVGEVLTDPDYVARMWVPAVKP